MGAICFGQQGGIIGGGSDFPDAVPANGKVKTAARLLVSGTPYHCEMTVQPSDFSRNQLVVGGAQTTISGSGARSIGSFAPLWCTARWQRPGSRIAHRSRCRQVSIVPSQGSPCSAHPPATMPRRHRSAHLTQFEQRVCVHLGSRGFLRAL